MEARVVTDLKRAAQINEQENWTEEEWEAYYKALAEANEEEEEHLIQD